jgi:hypothetical protein
MAIMCDEEIKFDQRKTHIFKDTSWWRTKEQRNKKKDWWGYRIARYVTFEPQIVNKLVPVQGGPVSLGKDESVRWHEFITQQIIHGQ